MPRDLLHTGILGAVAQIYGDGGSFSRVLQVERVLRQVKPQVEGLPEIRLLGLRAENCRHPRFYSQGAASIRRWAFYAAGRGPYRTKKS